MRLVKKSINQDDPSVYHLFYADEIGNPGTDLTFFEIPNAGRTHTGNNSISGTSLRVPNDKALEYWIERFDKFNVKDQKSTRLNSSHVKSAYAVFCFNKKIDKISISKSRVTTISV